MNFLGHVLGENGASPESGKLDVVRDWPVFKNVTHV